MFRFICNFRFWNGKKKILLYTQQVLKHTLSNSGTKTLGKTTFQVLFDISTSIHPLTCWWKPVNCNTCHQAYPCHYTTELNFPPTKTALRHLQMIIGSHCHLYENPRSKPSLNHLHESHPQNKKSVSYSHQLSKLWLSLEVIQGTGKQHIWKTISFENLNEPYLAS